MSDLNISIVDSLQGLQELGSRWKEPEGNFFLSWEWMQTWWEMIGQRQKSTELCVIAMESEGELVGFAPLFLECSSVLGKTLKYIGSGAACSDRMTFPARSGYEETIGKAVAEVLDSPQFTARFGAVAIVELEGHIDGDEATQAFFEAADRRGYEITTRELEGAWKVDLPSDWESFRKLIKKSHRRKVNKVTKLMETGDFAVEYIESAAELERAWPDFVDLHQKRRNQLGQGGCFLDSEFERFLLAASKRLMDSRRGLMTMIKRQGRPLGAILCFRSGDCLGVYQSGLDTEMSEFEPGHFANSMTAKSAIDQGSAAIDFLRGDEPYKAGWGCERTALYRSRVVAPRFLAQTRHRIFEQGRQIRDWSSNLWKWSTASFSGTGGGSRIGGGA